MGSPTNVLLVAFGLVVLALLGRAFLRRGKNLLDAVELLPGEHVLGEHDVELSAMPRRRAVVQSLSFMRSRARITSERVLLAQPGLGGGRPLVLRFVVHRAGARESEWMDGYGTFAIDPARSGTGERGGVRELRLAPRDDAPILPAFVVVRGSGLDAVGEALGVLGQPASVT